MAKKETIPTIIDTPEALTAKMAAMKEAQKIFATYTQEQVDKIFKAAATAADKMRIPLAKMAVEETGMGIMEDKVIKNHYAAEYVYNAYKNTQTCGVVEEDKAYGLKKILEPVGLIAAVIPTTNPTSTAIYKSLISLKTRVMRSSSARIRVLRNPLLKLQKLFWKQLLPQVRRKESSDGSISQALTLPTW